LERKKSSVVSEVTHSSDDDVDIASNEDSHDQNYQKAEDKLKRRSPRLERKKSPIVSQVTHSSEDDVDIARNEDRDDPNYQKADDKLEDKMQNERKVLFQSSSDAGNSTNNSAGKSTNLSDYMTDVKVNKQKNVSNESNKTNVDDSANNNENTGKSNKKINNKRKKEENVRKNNISNGKKLKVVESSGLMTQTLTQMYTPDGKRKKGKKKPAKQLEEIPEETCTYHIPCFEGAPFEDVNEPTHHVDYVKMVSILNIRKGKGWMTELFVKHNNGVQEWIFVHGVWSQMADETEAFMMHYGLDFEICGYKKDPRVGRRYQYLKKFYDEFTEEEIKQDPDKDYDKLTLDIHKKLSENVLEHYFVEEETSDDDVEQETSDDDVEEE
jgi:hypothetical protein